MVESHGCLRTGKRLAGRQNAIGATQEGDHGQRHAGRETCHHWRAVLGGVLLAGLATAAHAQGGAATLGAVKGRDQLVCGVAGNIAGFLLPDSEGIMRGIEADGCRVVAAAIFGDLAKVTYAPLSTENRCIALQSAEADVLIRTAAWSIGRETRLGDWPCRTARRP